MDRIYGSKERRRWIKSLPCLACCLVSPIFALADKWSCENAHVVTGGMGRKADASHIVPLCRTHHRWFDERRGLLGEPVVRQIIVDAAPKFDEAWTAYLAARVADPTTPEPYSSAFPPAHRPRRSA